jgi:hypothetical protein
MKQGVTVCEDNCFGKLAPHHYLRRAWTDFARERLSLELDPVLSCGFNGGFVGVHRSDRAFLKTWKRALEALPELGMPMEKLKPGTRHDVFFGTDQDMLNIAALAHPERISSLGPEGMGFAPGMSVLWHAVENPKPWRRNFLLDLIRTGRQVPRAHREYWRYASGPLGSWSSIRLFLKRLNLKAAVVLSRFYHSA